MQKNLLKIKNILVSSIPILVMIGLIPVIVNDYALTLAYVFISLISFLVKYEKGEYIFYLFGLVAITISEYIFISTGVEIFVRNSLFGVMPLWLPFLWAYGFVVIKRGIEIIKY